MYKLINDKFTGTPNAVYSIKDDVVQIIPFDLTNIDYQKYLRWLDEGNTPEPANQIVEPTPLTPQEKLANAGLSVEELKTLLGLS